MGHTAGVEALRAEEFSYSLFGGISFLPTVVNGKGAASVIRNQMLPLQLKGL